MVKKKQKEFVKTADQIILPINPHMQAKQSKKSEFLTDIGHIASSGDDAPGFLLQTLMVIWFIIKWPFYFLGKTIKRIKYR